MNYCFALFVAILLCGCMGTLPMNHQSQATSVTKAQSESKERTNVEKIVEGQPIAPNESAVNPSVTVSGSSNQVSVKIESPEPLEPLPLPVPSTGYKQTIRLNHNHADSNSVSESMFSSTSVRLPISVAILLLAIACSIFTFLAWLAFKKSRALSLLASSVDSFLADEIRKHRTIAMTSTDSQIIAERMEQIASLEASRGRLAI